VLLRLPAVAGVQQVDHPAAAGGRLHRVHAHVDRSAGRVATAGQAQTQWTLDRRAGQLIAPDGAHIDLSESDLAVMDCFLHAQGQPVTRETLLQRLTRGASPPAADGLNATIYRLRRRIERATPSLVPLQSKSRVGYVFRAPLRAL
jgi:DNA-binding response OmpR family regulator